MDANTRTHIHMHNHTHAEQRPAAYELANSSVQRGGVPRSAGYRVREGGLGARVCVRGNCEGGAEWGWGVRVHARADGYVTVTYTHSWVYICLVRPNVLKSAKMDAVRTDTHLRVQVVIGRCDGVGEEDGSGGRHVVLLVAIPYPLPPTTPVSHVCHQRGRTERGVFHSRYRCLVLVFLFQGVRAS